MVKLIRSRKLCFYSQQQQHLPGLTSFIAFDNDDIRFFETRIRSKPALKYFASPQA